MNLSFIKNLEVDEIRSGFLVTSHQKRLWNAQIGLILEFDRICKKHDLKYFAVAGTLLGVARHGGFIPWDFDVDLVMPRPDYEKFKLIAKDEVHYPFCSDLWYENVEYGDEAPETFPLLPFIKFRDERTYMLVDKDHPKFDQGIAIDIFPYDSFPPFDDEPNSKDLELQFRSIYEIYFAACHTKFIREELAHPTGEFMLGRETVQRIYDLSLKTRGILLEKSAAKFYHESSTISLLIHLSLRNTIKFKREWFDETIYLPFENISLPVPKKFDEVLTAQYGDWRFTSKSIEYR